MLQYLPYIVYADFETCLIPTEPNDPNMTANTIHTHTHQPSSFCYQIVTRNVLDTKEYKPYLYRGADATKMFWKRMHTEAQHIRATISACQQPIIIHPDDERELRSAINPICYLCQGVITPEQTLVLDHDHLAKAIPDSPCEHSSNVRGIAHAECNLAFQLPKMIPVVFHNGSKYDFRLIISDCVVPATTTSAKPASRRSNGEPKRKRARRSAASGFVDDEVDVEDGSEDEPEMSYEAHMELMEDFIVNDDEVDESMSEDEELTSVNVDDDMIGVCRQGIKRTRVIESDDDGAEEEEEERESDDIDESNDVIQIISQEEEGKKSRLGELKVIATSTENFISFEKHLTEKWKLRFLDSYRFLSDSLSRLAALLDKTDMKHVRRIYGSDEEMEIACRKGVFPYEYMSDPSKYNDTCLPPIEKFSSSLTGEHITMEEYIFAQKAWRVFNCKNLGDYNDHYLQIDVLLLADVFEKFRDTCFNIYKIDPAHCYSAPSLSFNAMLKTLGHCIDRYLY